MALRRFWLAVPVAGLSMILSCIGVGEVAVGQDDRAWREVEEDVRVQDVHYREWKEGRLLWHLDARQAAYHLEEEKAIFQDVSLVYHPPEGGGALTLKADSARYEMGPRRLKAEGNVLGEGAEGFRFRTGSLAYDLDSKRVSTCDKVILEKDRLRVEGIGLEGSLVDQTFVLLSSVRTVLVPPDTLR